MALERLQKILARAGVASRRKSEAVILDGRVRVNGTIVKTLGAKADSDVDRIEVDGRKLTPPRASTYIMLHKPAGVVTTASDEFKRETVLDLVQIDTRVFPVGRLDLDAEGLLLMTNDGEMAAALMHPSGEVPKTYRVKIRGKPSDNTLVSLMQGVLLDDGPAQAQHVHRVSMGHRAAPSNTWIELTVTEGRNHLIKRMFEAIGHPVVRLRRMAIAHLTLDGIRPGKWRHLNNEELRKLRAVSRAAGRKRHKSRETD
ncbi:MAG: 23S rRNA pseudouridine2605 synthase [Bradymonadia bacterium]|jgi:23S rRNA pseudouridine2605 synthase